jgi:hypothetical protein
MIEVELAIAELRRRRAETQRQISFEERTSKPNTLKIRALESESAKLYTKLQRLQFLDKEASELERTLSLKMMTRYPENRPYRNEYKRELTRTRRQLKELASNYQPKPKTRPAYAF